MSLRLVVTVCDAGLGCDDDDDDDEGTLTEVMSDFALVKLVENAVVGANLLVDHATVGLACADEASGGGGRTIVEVTNDFAVVKAVDNGSFSVGGGLLVGAGGGGGFVVLVSGGEAFVNSVFGGAGADTGCVVEMGTGGISRATTGTSTVAPTSSASPAPSPFAAAALRAARCAFFAPFFAAKVDGSFLRVRVEGDFELGVVAGDDLLDDVVSIDVEVDVEVDVDFWRRLVDVSRYSFFATTGGGGGSCLG